MSKYCNPPTHTRLPENPSMYHRLSVMLADISDRLIWFVRDGRWAGWQINLMEIKAQLNISSGVIAGAGFGDDGTRGRAVGNQQA